MNPAPFSHAIAYRVAQPILSNAGNRTGEDFVYPGTFATREAALAGNPCASAWTFLRIQNALIDNMLAFPTPPSGQTERKMPSVAKYRARGVLGSVSSFFLATET